jgi:hypothetical protein
MSLRDHLQAIYEQHGKLTPAVVLEEARSVEHPLHDRFEWDDDVAAEKWRKRQARELIRSVRIVYKEATDTDPGKSIRAFHAVRGTDDESVYEPAEVIAEDPLLRAMLLRDAEREWKQLLRRYKDIAEFVDMVRTDIEQQLSA